MRIALQSNSQAVWESMCNRTPVVLPCPPRQTLGLTGFACAGTILREAPTC